MSGRVRNLNIDDESVGVKTADETWPVGQAAKTPPSHGGIGSSILPRVTI